MTELTVEQQGFWDELNMGSSEPSEGQNPASNALSFRHACMLEGVPVPSQEAVLAHMKEAGDG